MHYSLTHVTDKTSAFVASLFVTLLQVVTQLRSSGVLIF